MSETLHDTTLESIEFTVGGVRVAGHLHRPLGRAAVPGLIVGGPMTSVKEQVTGVYAAALARRGFAALAIDHRHFGQSGGQPRQFEHHGRKREDLLAAVEFLAGIRGVDADRMAGVGICLGAGYIASAVTQDLRLRAFVGIAGYYRNPGEIRARDPAAFDSKVLLGKQELAKYELTGEARLIPAASMEHDAAMQTRDTVDYYTRRAAVENYRNEFAVMSRATFLNFDVQCLAPQIRVPSLIVHSPKALSPEWATRFFDKLPGSKEIAWTNSAGQTDFYDDPARVEEASKRAAVFLLAAFATPN